MMSPKNTLIRKNSRLVPRWMAPWVTKYTITDVGMKVMIKFMMKFPKYEKNILCRGKDKIDHGILKGHAVDNISPR